MFCMEQDALVVIQTKRVPLVSTLLSGWNKRSVLLSCLRRCLVAVVDLNIAV